MVRRLFVEKRSGFDIEAAHILADLRESLGVTGITALRLLNRYDVSGLSDDEFAKAKELVFSEPQTDAVYDEDFTVNAGDIVFACEYLPGQYDQRADSAAQCVQLLTQGARPAVQTAKVYVFSGEISPKELDRIKSYLVNPVESRPASNEKPETLEPVSSVPADIADVAGFIDMDKAAISEYWSGMGFAMTPDDLEFCRNYFRDGEHRDPTVTELKVIDTYWSDHCRHTTFSTRLANIEIEKSELNRGAEEALDAYRAARREVYGERNKPVCLMDIATMGMRLLKKRGLLDNLDESDEINACSIEVPVTIDGVTEQWLVQFKNETHNHPTEIEPFGGAATCLGGAIRDPLSGRAYVYQAMRVTGAGNPLTDFDDTLDGKLPQKKITTSAAHGYSSYGNQIGLATGQVTELYDDGYLAKRMEIGAVIGASPKANVKRLVPAEGDIIVLLGGRTGRDGCGGATGSSKAHDTKSIETCGAEVQKGNPPTERKIQRLFRKHSVASMIKRCNDFGAGGVCVAIGELADGLRIDLDAVPKKYEGLDGTELAISESQERMAVVLDPSDVDKFIAEADGENLEAVPVAVVTNEARLVMNWRGKTIVDISREFLNTNGVTGVADAYIEAPDPAANYRESVPAEVRGKVFSEALIADLSRLNVCSQKGLCERFDASIGASTVLMPFAGKYQLSPEEAMVAKIPLEHGETDTATAMSYGFIPAVSSWSPFHGAAFAVVESLSKLLCVGADPLSARLTFQEYFERLHEDPKRWGKPAAALLGAFAAQCGLGVPSIGGKDSMSGSFNELDVPPTLVSFAVAMTSAEKTLSSVFSTAGDKAYLVEIPLDAATRLPDYDKLRSIYSTLYDYISKGNVHAAAVVREGGAAACIAKMCFGNKMGFAFNGVDPEKLFAPLGGSIVLTVDVGANLPDGVEALELGTVTDSAVISYGDDSLLLDEAVDAWCGKLESVFASNAAEPSLNTDIPLYTERGAHSPAIKTAKPRVFIPVFPGTNCEVDSARAFERAGAIPQILVVNNLSAVGIEETIAQMERLIRESQIVMIPGGFSGGDEPDGSGKFIATTFRNPKISDAVNDLLKNRDGLMLGICNGFQALIKLGLVPYGEIRDLTDSDPTLTFNTLGRHVSRMVYTRVTSVKSPWLSLCSAGDIHAVPVSHGEGRFVATPEVAASLAANGQICTQYTDPNGTVRGETTWNPNGSVCGIEGITSPDGRVLGKMGHSERCGENICKNVPGNKDQKIFASGVAYFK